MEKVEQDFVILPGGVHLWGPDSSYLGAVPDEVIAGEAAGQTLHTFETPAGWSMLESKSVVVTGDVPEEALRVLAVMSDELLKMLARELGGPPPRSRYQIRVFGKLKDFCDYAGICGASTAASFYNPRNQEVALHFGPETNPDDFEATVGHELTHAYMDRVYGVTEPLWFAEGMAEYFSRVKWTRNGYRPTGNNWKAMLSLDTEDLLPLPIILAATGNEMHGVQFNLFYAQAWVLAHFLIKKHPEAIESLLMKRPVHLSFDRNYLTYLKKLRGD